MAAVFHPDLLRQILQKYPPAPHYLLALSGGLDSVVLLHAVAQIRSDSFFNSCLFQVIHVHHGLQDEADDWALQCQNLCASLSLPCLVERVDARPQGSEGVEAAAREARYAAFARHLQPQGVLLTAHHQNDQAETLLLRLLRGSGLSGLAAMAECRSFAQGFLLRPLLSLPRRALATYAEKQGLVWLEDPSNHSLDYDRNYLRHQILPRLSERWLGAVKTLSRATELVAESNELLQELAVYDLARLSQRDADVVLESLPLAELKKLSEPRLNNLLRYWLAQLKLPTPSQAQLKRVKRELLLAKADRQPLVDWAGVELRRYDGRIYAMSPLPPLDGSKRYRWTLSEPLLIDGLAEPLSVELLSEIRLLLPESNEVEVAFRQGGEQFHLAGRGMSKPLKTLFQEAKVLPWQRHRLPLIFIAGQLAAVVGLGVAQAFVDKSKRYYKSSS